VSRPRTHVTDHALVRYLERVGGFDIEALRQAIARRVDEAARVGACGVVIDGFIFKLRRDQHGPVVTTVLIAGGDPAPDPGQIGEIGETDE